jgi:hypothetical protein
MAIPNDISEHLHSSLIVRHTECGGAIFDRTERYRYLLWRKLPACNKGRRGASRILLVMLNPNTADESHNDPTIRRCIGFAESWDYGCVEVVNLFAYRAREPLILKSVKKPVGTYNDEVIRQRAIHADLLMVAWGNHGKILERDRAVLKLLAECGPVYCLGTTNSGAPKHPLYIRSDAEPIAFH